MKQCTKCKQWKPLSDFRKDKSRQDGLFLWCVVCCRENDRERYSSNPGKWHAKSRKWKAANREKVNELERKWNAAHPDRVRERRRKWRIAHPEKVREWITSNVEKVREIKHRWIVSNPEKKRELTRNRRAKIKGNGGKITTDEWMAVLDKYGHKCLYPGCDRTDVTMDHIVPIYLGGTHTIDNVQPLCKSHNSGKKIKTVDYRPFA